MIWLAAIAGAAYDKEHHVEAARLYGNVDKYAYYFIDLLIGSPVAERSRSLAIVKASRRRNLFPWLAQFDSTTRKR